MEFSTHKNVFYTPLQGLLIKKITFMKCLSFYQGLENRFTKQETESYKQEIISFNFQDGESHIFVLFKQFV